MRIYCETMPGTSLKPDDSGEDEGDLKEMGSGEAGSDNLPEGPLQAPFTVPPGEHRLQFAYSLWFSRRTPGNKATSMSYDQNLKLVATFLSVEQFWSYYSYLIRPSDLSGHSDFHLFKDGIKPMWEDSANKDGGKWIVRLRKGLASRCWENLILAMLGEQFMVGEEICGAVISIRFQEDIISVWNKSASHHATTSRIRDTLKRVLNLPANTIMEYKTHQNSKLCELR